MTDACLTFRDLTLGYNSHPAVHHLSGAVKTGSLTAVVGANGSGKSTLMKGIVGVLKPMAGASVTAPGTASPICRSNPSSIGRFRRASSTWFRWGCGRSAACSARFTKDDRASVSQALTAVGLEGFESRPIDTLSGGQLQRTLFARVLVQDAEIILLDEPFNAIDAKTVVDLVALIKRWQGEKRTIIVAVHDLNLVREHFPRNAASGAPSGRMGSDGRGAQARKTCSARAASTRPGTTTPLGASRKTTSMRPRACARRRPPS